MPCTRLDQIVREDWGHQHPKRGRDPSTNHLSTAEADTSRVPDPPHPHPHPPRHRFSRADISNEVRIFRIVLEMPPGSSTQTLHLFGQLVYLEMTTFVSNCYVSLQKFVFGNDQGICHCLSGTSRSCQALPTSKPCGFFRLVF